MPAHGDTANNNTFFLDRFLDFFPLTAGPSAPWTGMIKFTEEDPTGMTASSSDSSAVNRDIAFYADLFCTDQNVCKNIFKKKLSVKSWYKISSQILSLVHCSLNIYFLI